MAEIRAVPGDLQQLGAAWVRDASDFHGSVAGARSDLQDGVHALAHPAAQASMQAFTDRLHQTLVAIAQIKAAMGQHLIASGQGYEGTDAATARNFNGGQG